MKNIILLIVTFLFIACSSPLEKKFNEETFGKDIELIKKNLSLEDFEILENTIIRLDFNREQLEQMTYSEILEIGKNQKSSTKKRQSKIIQLVNFDKEKKLRFKKVIDKLIIIIDAELAYHKENRVFTNDKNELAKFIDTYEKDLFKVPYTDKEFHIEVGFINKFDIKMPVFEVKVDKESILKGLNPSLIKDEKNAIGKGEIRGEFIIIGSLESAIRSGNWPSFYD